MDQIILLKLSHYSVVIFISPWAGDFTQTESLFSGHFHQPVGWWEDWPLNSDFFLKHRIASEIQRIRQYTPSHRVQEQLLCQGVSAFRLGNTLLHIVFKNSYFVKAFRLFGFGNTLLHIVLKSNLLTLAHELLPWAHELLALAHESLPLARESLPLARELLPLAHELLAFGP